MKCSILDTDIKNKCQNDEIITKIIKYIITCLLNQTNSYERLFQAKHLYDVA